MLAHSSGEHRVSETTVERAFFDTADNIAIGDRSIQFYKTQEKIRGKMAFDKEVIHMEKETRTVSYDVTAGDVKSLLKE